MKHDDQIKCIFTEKEEEEQQQQRASKV